MKSIKTFEQFISSLQEDTITPNKDSKVEIDAITTHDGTEISSEEIVGIIVSCESEKEVKEKLYDKFGQTAFTEEDISKILAYFNSYEEEVNKEEQEKEKKDKEGGDGGDGGEDLGDLTKGL